MPLFSAAGRSKKAISSAVSKNIHELYHHGKKKRSMRQIIAISENAARKTKSLKR